MTATEKLSEVLSGNYNLEFEVVEVIKEGISMASINETVYIRQGGPFGGVMTVLNYGYAIEEIQKCGAMKQFGYGHYDFFSHWKIQCSDPLTLVQIENDSIESIKLTAIDTASIKDIIMEISVADYIIRCSKCRYIF